MNAMSDFRVLVPSLIYVRHFCFRLGGGIGSSETFFKKKTFRKEEKNTVKFSVKGCEQRLIKSD